MSEETALKEQTNGHAEPTITVSISQKIGMPNYGSAEAFVSISGMKPGTTEAEINELLDTGKLGWKLMGDRMRQKIDEIRETYK